MGTLTALARLQLFHLIMKRSCDPNTHGSFQKIPTLRLLAESPVTWCRQKELYHPSRSVLRHVQTQETTPRHAPEVATSSLLPVESLVRKAALCLHYQVPLYSLLFCLRF